MGRKFRDASLTKSYFGMHDIYINSCCSLADSNHL